MSYTQSSRLGGTPSLSLFEDSRWQSLQPESSHTGVGRTALPTGPNRRNGKVCLHQLSESICIMGALESQHVGMRKGMDSLSSGEGTKAHRADDKANISLNASFVYVP